MYIDTYNTNNEDERFKKYVEILKSHDQLKKSLWNKINTPEVLKLKEEVAYQKGQVVSKTLAQNEALSVTFFF